MKKRKKILYIANARIPTEKAHGIQIMKMCEAFVNAGVELDLIIPKRINWIKEDAFSYYGVDSNFKIKKIINLDTINIIKNKLGFVIQSVSFAISVLFFLPKNESSIIYSRDQFSLFLLSFFKRFNVFYEVHNLPQENSFFFKVLLKKTKLIVISNGLKNKLIEFGVDKHNILVAPDGVSLESFTNVIDSKENLRQELSIEQNKKIIMYVGHLYGWKGANILLEASKYLSDYRVYFIGGLSKDIDEFSAQIKKLDLSNVRLLGHKDYKDIPKYLKTADVLVLPNSGKEKVSKYYTSPMKLFEYMASGVPIVASKLPSIKEILDDSEAILVESDNVEALVHGIKIALSNKELSDKMSNKALQDVRQYTWKARANKILTFIK